MEATGQITRQDVRRARNDLGFFAELIGRPLQPWQLESLQLGTRHTVIVGPRQVGKSWSLAVLACWWAMGKRRQHVLVMSAMQDSADELLANVREIAEHPLVAGAVDEALKTRVNLRNGSWIRSLASTQAAPRGKSIDLLIIDEASLVDSAVLNAAALPTTLARPQARIIFASTPWSTSGAFYQWAQAGLDGSDPDTKTFQWSLSQAPWIVPSVIESARRRMPALQFRAEILGEWVGAGDAYFDADDIRAAVALYPLRRDGGGAEAVMGVDWGRMADAHGIVVGGVLDDYGANGRSVVAVAYAETSRRRYEDQVTEISEIAATWKLTVMSETVGVGAAPTEQLASKLTRSRVRQVKTTQVLKQDLYGKAAVLFAEHRVVIAAELTELISQLETVTATPTPGGGLRIGTPTESVHDDLADAFVFMLAGLPDTEQIAEPPVRPVPDGTRWVTSAAGVRVPVPISLIRPDLSWGAVSGGYWHCPVCRRTVPSYRKGCTTQGCQGRNPGPVTDPPWGRDTPAMPALAVAGAVEPGDNSVPESNYWCQHWRRCLRCRTGFDGSLHDDKCPRCSPGAGGSRPGMPLPGPLGGGMPPALANRLGPFLGPRR